MGDHHAFLSTRRPRSIEDVSDTVGHLLGESGEVGRCPRCRQRDGDGSRHVYGEIGHEEVDILRVPERIGVMGLIVCCRPLHALPQFPIRQSLTATYHRRLLRHRLCMSTEE